MSEVNFTPSVINVHTNAEGKKTHVTASIAVNVKVCEICERLIKPDIYDRRNVTKLNAQMDALGAVDASELSGYFRAICSVCEREGRFTFTCYSCKQERTSDLLHETISSENFCEVCFETKSAKEWQVSVEKAEEEHKYDSL